MSLSAPVKVAEVPGAEARPLVLDRMGHPIAHSFDRAWNLNHRLKLEEVPALMIKGLAHAHGLTGHGLATRVAREVHGLGSSPWQRWLSTCDGVRLSQQNTRDELMEFFINQVPIAKSQRGVLAGARTFFGVEPYALSATQTIALVAMTLDPERLAADSAALQRAKEALAQALLTNGHFDQRTFAEIQSAPVSLAAFDLGGSAPEFFSFVISRPEALTLGPVLKTTLDPRLQKHAQQTLDERTRGRAAVIIADHEADQILAWAVARDRSSNSASLNELLALRAAGTMLNPFV